MPAFAATLTENDRWDLVNFLRSARDFGLFSGKTRFFTHGLDLAKMGALSKMNTERSFLQHLHGLGYETADDWGAVAQALRS